MSDEARRARGARATQTMLAEFKAQQEAVYREGGIVVCWLCNQHIDMTLEDIYDDEHFEPDHVFPVSTHPELASDPDSVRPSHRGCNRERGNSMEGIGLGWTSENWEGLATIGASSSPSTRPGRPEPEPSSTEYAVHRTVDTSGYPDLDDPW